MKNKAWKNRGGKDQPGIIFKKEPWEGGKGGSWFRLSPRVGSVNGNVVRGRILKNLRATISER